MEVARAERVRFQKRDVSTEFQSKKLRTRNLRGNSRASPDVFLSSALPRFSADGFLSDLPRVFNIIVYVET